MLQKKGRIKYILLSGFLLLSLHTECQIFINEFAASNSTIIEDPDFKNYADWVELYNTGEQTVNLNGYFLTDNLNIPDKWQIPVDIFIQPGGFLIIWCDGHDTGLHAGFKLSAGGEQIGLYSPEQKVIDTLTYSLQHTDISCGRIRDGDTLWGYFLQPTPQASNLTPYYTGFVENTPMLSPRGGMYDSPISVIFSTDQGGEIRYTLDGSEPDTGSALYTNAIPVNSTLGIRARIFKPEMIPGPVVTHTYFIRENSVNAKLPVVSIATAPENFWDPVKGIYVQSFKPDWAVPVNIELFENDGGDRAAFNETAGTKINGLHSWQLPQKMLGIYFKKQYGKGHLDYPLFCQRQRSSFRSFSLRASGSDWSYTLFRDILGQHATLFNMDLDIESYKPVVVYVNGQYMGVHNMREKIDADYIEKSYGLEPGTFDIIENEKTAEAGDMTAYNHLLALLAKDLSVMGNFIAVAQVMDIENFTDYAITELYVSNTSVGHNVMAWKPKSGGKWRWILVDLDRGFFHPTDHLIGSYVATSTLPLKELMQNEGYKDYFMKRLADHLLTTFQPDRMKQLIEVHKQMIMDEMPRHIACWQGTTSSYGNAIPSYSYWLQQIDVLRNFVEKRPDALWNDMKNWGYGNMINLFVMSSPEKAGNLSFNRLKIPQGGFYGRYIKGAAIEIRADNIPGYQFVGWANTVKKTIISAGSEWKYLDNGTYPGMYWMNSNYDDATWKSGYAQLGYGDGDENTVVSYGDDSQNKYITTYFRRNFTLTENDLHDTRFAIDLLRDDGAVVYINGKEVLRSNMNEGYITYQTTATSAVANDLESQFFTYNIDKDYFVTGKNTIAVEVHQISGTSSDISFDLRLSCFSADRDHLLTTEPVYTVTLTDNTYLTALFDKTADCILPDTISSDLVLEKSCSPYLARGDVTIRQGANLMIEPGVEIWMPRKASITVNGAIIASGTGDDPVVFTLNPQQAPDRWGILRFRNSSDTSRLTNVIIENASKGDDPVLDIAAISAFKANIIMDSMILMNNRDNPVTARYSDIVLTHSFLHSDASGDLINIKYGHARIENCRFTGNDQANTDAIDLDGIQNGVIRNCEITHLTGFNSDAVDIGEECENITLDSLWVYYVADKGISIGQHSSATLQNSIFVNCNMGVGAKDSGRIVINHCLFYGNGNGVTCFEKNPGQAGGDAIVTNSILSNSFISSVYADRKSKLSVSYSVSDNDTLPDPGPNRNTLSLFVNPNLFDFRLLQNSPVQGTASDEGDPGISHAPFNWSPEVMISQIYFNPAHLDYPEFITLYNPSDQNLDLSGYAVTKGVTAMFPEQTHIEAHGMLYVTNAAASDFWNRTNEPVIAWESGHLSHNGEAIQLEDPHGIVIDFVRYQQDGRWPEEGFTDTLGFTLKGMDLDNHIPENWQTATLDQILGIFRPAKTDNLIVYPNPTTGLITVRTRNLAACNARVYNIHGILLFEARLDPGRDMKIDLALYGPGVYFIRAGQKTHEVVVVR